MSTIINHVISNSYCMEKKKNTDKHKKNSLSFI